MGLIGLKFEYIGYGLFKPYPLFLNKDGNKYEKKAQIVGGVILIVLGIKILLEHLGVLPF